MVEVEGSHCVDVAVARLNDKLMINLVNSAGPHADENIYTYDEVPSLGPLTVKIRLKRKPRSIELQPGNRNVQWEYRRKTAMVTVPRVDLHDILKVEQRDD
jgi:hypothetical protein